MTPAPAFNWSSVVVLPRIVSSYHHAIDRKHVWIYVLKTVIQLHWTSRGIIYTASFGMN